MQLTPSQQKALGTERHLAITANAGSGKTRVLVQRYVDLFKKYDNLTIRNVVAITFTENAANELRRRILNEVEERIKNLSPNDRKGREYLRTLRDSLPSAFIGTIHAFAGRILHAYPVEANVDASFAILTGADQRLLIEEAISTVFYSSLEQAYDAKAESPILHLFRTLGRSDVTMLVRTLIGNRIRAEKVSQRLLAKTEDEVIGIWRTAIERVFSFVERDETKALFAELGNNLKDGVRGRDASELIQTYLSATGLFESAYAFYRAAIKLITQKDQLNSQSIDLKNLPETLLADLQDLISFFSPLRSFFSNSPENEAAFIADHREYLILLRAVFELYREVLDQYTTTKIEYGRLDFDDLILTLQRLLENQQVCEELSSEFRFIMIDEYQDTDESQFELAKLLTKNFGARNNLTIVGDPKQAIYTFRNADAAVFNITKVAIAEQPLSEKAMEESVALGLLPHEEFGSLSLAETFRMTKTPLAAINRLFRSVMQSDNSSFAEEDMVYSDLVHGRSAVLDGKVEWICPIAQKKPSKDTEQNLDEELTDEDEITEESEAKLIALKIKSCAQVSAAGYEVEDDGQKRAAAWGDIAILLRSRTNLPLLERALFDEGIPYSVAKGSGFYSQQEILDISSYLSFLVSDSDNIALAAILRSPFFAVSDVELFQIAHHESTKRRSPNNPWSFWQQFQSYASFRNLPHLQRSVSQLRENLILAGRTGTAFIVEKIYAETGIFATLFPATQGMQKVANLEKFLAQARSSDTSGFSGLFEFVERIRYLTDSEEQESQADAEETRGAVKIMTVHAAKGLEFPIVILPFLQKKFKFDYVRLLDKELGLQLKLPSVSADERDRKPLISELIRLRSRASTIAEEKRIFYVATTRARDHLIFSCTLPENPPKDSWLAWAGEAFGLDATSDMIHIEEEIMRYDSDSQKASAEMVSFDIPLIRKASDIEVAEQSTVEEAVSEPGPSYFYPLQIARSTSRFSATQLLRFKECPTKYHLSYVLGMPEEPKLAYDMIEDEAIYSETVRGQMLGQIVHKVLDKIQGIAPNGIFDEMQFSNKINAVFQSLGISDFNERNKYSFEVHKNVTNFLDSPIASEVFESTNSKSEFSLETLLHSGDTLFGIIDRLFLDANGMWTVLDYKTERQTDPERKKKNLDRYKFQLLFYSYLVHLMDSKDSSVRAVIFFTSSGETAEFIFDSSDFTNLVADCSSTIRKIRADENIADLRSLQRNIEHCPECSFFNIEKQCCAVLAPAV